MRAISKTDYYPPQRVPGPVPATVETLTLWLEEQGSDPQAFFALGCIHLRAGELEKAVSSFEETVVADPTAAEAHCNLGLCLLLLEREDDALAHLKQAVLIKPDLDLAYLHLARLQQRRGDTESAIQSLERVLRHQPGSVDALTLLGELWESQGDEAQAERYYLQSFALKPKQRQVRNRLGWFAFRRGKAAFEQGLIYEAFGIWGEGYEKYPRAFSSDKEVARELYQLIKSCNEQRLLPREIERYRITLKQEGSVPPADIHRLLCVLYFSLGLLPELYSPFEKLAEELAYWQAQASVEEEILPFPKFRVAVLHSYLGQFQAALEDMRYCQDYLPKSKQQALRLKEILGTIGEISGIRVDSGGKVRESDAGKDEWERAGFKDPFQQQAWKRSGLSPFEAEAWKREGFSAAQAQAWAGQSFPPVSARQWTEAGFTDAKAARRWLRGDFTPDEAARWLLYFEDSVEKAVQCRQAGFKDPETAERWLKVFMFPWEAIRWFELGFATKDAAVYLAQGVKDPFQAKRQQEAEQALELERKLPQESKKTE